MFYKISILLLVFIFTPLLYASQTIAAVKGYSLDGQLTDSKILLGESTQLTLIYKYKDLEDYEFSEPSFDGIVVEELDSKDYKNSDGSFVEEVNYKLTPQKEGNFTLENLEVKTEIITGEYKNFDNRSKYTQKFFVKAKKLLLQVKKLPKNVSVIGNYTLQTKVDKSNVKAKELVTLTLSLYGEGNIENLDGFEPQIKGITSYLLYTTKSRRLKLQTKVYALIAEQTYTIPSFELLYFNKEDKAIQRMQTQPITIQIGGYKKEEKNNLNSFKPYLYFFLGALSVVVLVLLYGVYKLKKKKGETKLINRVKKCRTQKELYKIVVLFLGKEKHLDTLIYKLEDEHLPNFKAIKKEIVKSLTKLRLHERDNLLFTTKHSL